MNNIALYLEADGNKYEVILNGYALEFSKRRDEDGKITATLEIIDHEHSSFFSLKLVDK